MLNFTTNKNYQGSNLVALSGLGSEFCTFKQAVDFFKLTGKELKGAKASARLIKIVEKLQYNKVSKKKEKKKVPVYFNVFEKNHLVSVIQKNVIQKHKI
tara:strand:+ start:218 stop:514 length:297 start_codon:yes stop_codon:yes gene_type:complete